MKEKYKLILIGNYPTPVSGGGQAKSFKLTSDGLSKLGWNVVVINTIERHEKSNLIFRSIDYLGVFFKLLRNLLVNRKCVVYHIISSSNSGLIRDFLIIVTSKIFNSKIVIHSHNGNYDIFYDKCNMFFKYLIKYMFEKVDRIIILTKKLSKTFYFIKNPTIIRYIPNGIPDNPNNKAKEECNNEIHILFLSYLIEAKGYLEILEAANILKNKSNNVKYIFHFAGDFKLNPSQDRFFKSTFQAKHFFETFVKENKLEDTVLFHGVVSGYQKERLLNMSDVFILPTYFDVEAQPITIIEALAYGCALLSTNYRGISEMLIENYNGFFIEPLSPKDIVDKLGKLNSTLLKRFSDNSKELYLQRFTKEKYIENIDELFTEICTNIT